MINYYGRNMRPYSWLFSKTSKPIAGPRNVLPSFPAKGVRVQAYPYVLEILGTSFNTEQTILAMQNLEVSTSLNQIPMAGVNGGMIVGSEPAGCPLHVYQGKYPALFSSLQTTVSSNIFNQVVAHVDNLAERAITFSVWAGRNRDYTEEDSKIYEKTLRTTKDIASLDVVFTTKCYATPGYSSDTPGLPGSFTYYGPKLPQRSDDNKFENCFKVQVTYSDDSTQEFTWDDPALDLLPGQNPPTLYWPEGWGPSDLLFFPVVWIDYLDDAKLKNDAYYQMVSILDKFDSNVQADAIRSAVSSNTGSIEELDGRVTILEGSSGGSVEDMDSIFTR